MNKNKIQVETQAHLSGTPGSECQKPKTNQER